MQNAQIAQLTVDFSSPVSRGREVLIGVGLMVLFLRERVSLSERHSGSGGEGSLDVLRVLAVEDAAGRGLGLGVAQIGLCVATVGVGQDVETDHVGVGFDVAGGVLGRHVLYGVDLGGSLGRGLLDGSLSRDCFDGGLLDSGRFGGLRLGGLVGHWRAPSSGGVLDPALSESVRSEWR